MQPHAFVTASSHSIQEHKEKCASRNLPFVTAMQRVAKVAAIPAWIPRLRKEVHIWYLDLVRAW